MKRVERVEVEVYGRDGNAAIVRLPARRFPGLLIQGDSLSLLARDARKLAIALRVSADLHEMADDLARHLADLLAYYASSLAANGTPLPYHPEPPESE
jgi:hypothetical protein